MKTQVKKTSFMGILWGFLVLSGVTPFCAPGFSEQSFDTTGWEETDAYNQYYDVNTTAKLKGVVAGFKEEPPMEGMSPGVVMVVRTCLSMVDIHICPSWFLRPSDIRIRKGSAVTVKGCWADIQGKSVFMASKIKKNHHLVLKVRLTKTGKPFWTFTPEDLVQKIRKETPPGVTEG